VRPSEDDLRDILAEHVEAVVPDGTSLMPAIQARLERPAPTLKALDLDNGRDSDFGYGYGYGYGYDVYRHVGARELPARESRLEARVLDWLARLLPGGERERFVSEARGALADRDNRWQRFDYLVTLAMQMPGLAVWMCRQGRRA
jgi:hypothetical protein